jgi:Winged helix DNA-binding domain
VTGIAARRLHSQRLTGEPFASAQDVLSCLGAVQSQDYAGARWALGLRTRGLTGAGVDGLFDAGAILRTHVMRPTWHFVLPEDVRWLLELTAPRVKASIGFRDRELGIDAEIIRRGEALMTAALRDGTYLTRNELGAVLERSRLPASGPHMGHLTIHAELDGLIVSGPRKGRQLTYALLDERAPPGRRLDRDEALAELTRRYFASHGPAQLPDFTWWSGLTMTDARRGLALVGPDLVREEIDGTSYWSAGEGPPPAAEGPLAHLLPNFDEFTVAYRDRRAMIHPGLDISGLANGWVLSNVVAVDGLVRGGWKRRSDGREIVVELGPLAGLDAADEGAVEGAVAELERFLGVPVAIAGR